MHDFTYYAQILISGLTIGSLYALIAIGYTMVYGILRLINFAHGDMFMVAGFIMIYITSWSSGFLGAGSIAVGLILTLILTVVLGVMIEKVAYKPLRSAPRMSVMISAIGCRIFPPMSPAVWHRHTPIFRGCEPKSRLAELPCAGWRF